MFPDDIHQYITSEKNSDDNWLISEIILSRHTNFFNNILVLLESNYIMMI